jgi:CheY-like chemotaxis protein
MGEKIDILLVEDDPSDAELAIRAFKKCNITDGILHLKNGEEALDFLFSTGKYATRLQHNPRVIFLDLKMPKVSGLEVLRKIKADARTKVIPVVLLSSSSEEKDIAVCYECGANSYLVKPMDYAVFIESVCDSGTYWLTLNQPLL